jgi:hypothetical protein
VIEGKIGSATKEVKTEMNAWETGWARNKK